MKCRIGFVSNSSSSSFLIFFDKKIPTSFKQVENILVSIHGSKEKLTSQIKKHFRGRNCELDNDITDQVIRYVYNKLCNREKIRCSKKEIIVNFLKNRLWQFTWLRETEIKKQLQQLNKIGLNINVFDSKTIRNLYFKNYQLSTEIDNLHYILQENELKEREITKDELFNNVSLYRLVRRKEYRNPKMKKLRIEKKQIEKLCEQEENLILNKILPKFLALIESKKLALVYFSDNGEGFEGQFCEHGNLLGDSLYITGGRE
jgi:hypothetical protein